MRKIVIMLQATVLLALGTFMVWNGMDALVLSATVLNLISMGLNIVVEVKHGREKG